MGIASYKGSYRATVYENGEAVKFINFSGQFPNAIEESLGKRGIICAKVELVGTGTKVGVIDGKVVGFDVWEEAMRPKVIQITPDQLVQDLPMDEEAETSKEVKQKRVITATIGQSVSARGRGKVKKDGE